MVEDFLGWRVEADLALALNPRTAVLPAWDKFTLTLYAQAFGLPTPALVAAYRPGARASAMIGTTLIDSSDTLRRWLRDNDQWPIFAKPSYSQQSVGCHNFTAYRATDDALLTASGEAIAAAAFIDSISGRVKRPYYEAAMGYLFQRVLVPHPDIVALLGTTQISSVRIVLIQDEHGVEIVKAGSKLAGGESDTDRFDERHPAGLIADVSLDNGKLGIAASMRGRVTHVPRTGAALGGFQLPDWQEATALCAKAATMFPMLRIQHWDVALTDHGPVLLEVNDIGAIGWLQVFGSGILTPRLRALLRKHADPAKYRWVKRLCV